VAAHAALVGGTPPIPRAELAEVAQRVRPVVLAGERRLAVPGPLGEILPGGGLQRGSVVRVEGSVGSGATSLLLTLLAAATAAGEWAAVVDGDGVLGGLAAAEAGVALDRLAVVRAVPAALYSRVVATLLDGVTVVGATIPRGLRLADARRLEARARERAAVLVAAGSWPGEAALRLRAERSSWSGLGRGEGLLGQRALRVAVSGRGAAGRERVAELVTCRAAA
jgi:recA bacterial DNA recombination protein